MDEIEEIRSRIPIETLVAQYVQLKKAGKNYKGLCPFHNEKTPSFVVSPDKGLAYCFGCNNGGDIFKFTQLIERVSFQESLKLLADKAGVKLKEYSTGRKKNLTTQNIHEIVNHFYCENLQNIPEKKEYLYSRGVTDALIEKFSIGYAPDSFEETYSFLLEKGFSHKEIIDSGLAIAKNLTDLKIYDRFRDRIMFPITNVQHQTIAFGGRALKKDEPAKYLNSPETNHYSKSYVLYGLSLGKDAIRKKDQVIIVEGYLDVISSHKAGIENVVASSGTALTIQQIKLLKRYTKNFYFCFDTDNAGLEATKRACELAITEEVNIKIISIPDGKDPDECINNNPQDWIQAINEAKNFIEYYIHHLSLQYNVASIDGKKAYSQEILPLIKKIPNAIEQTYYLKKVSSILKVEIQAVHSELIKQKDVSIQNHKRENPNIHKQKYELEDYLLGICLNHKSFAKIAVEKLNPQFFSNSHIKSIYTVLQNIYNTQGNFVFSEVFNNSKELEEKYRVVSLFIEEKYKDFSLEVLNKEVEKIIQALNKKNLVTMRESLLQQMRESQNDEEKHDQLLIKYSEIMKVQV